MRLYFRGHRIRLSRKRDAVLARKTVALTLLLSLTVLFTVSLYNKASPIAMENAEAQARLRHESLLSQAVEAVMKDGNYTYRSFALWEKDASGKVVALSLNTTEIATFRTQLLARASQACKENRAIAVEVPIGTLLAPKFFGGKGFSVPIHATAYSALSITLVSEIRAAGINQTLHRIALSVTASTNLYCLKEKNSFTHTVTVPLAESLVYGTVPDGYFEYSG